jgi:hypothetical protein
MGGIAPSMGAGHSMLCPYGETATARLMDDGEASTCAVRTVRGCKPIN